MQIVAQALLCLLLHSKRFFHLLVRDDARRDQKIAQTHVRHIHPPPSAICRCMLRSCISGKICYCYKLFLKIVNNVQYFSPFRTYFTIHISFFLKFIVHFLPSADGSPVFYGNASPFPLFFQSFLAKQQEKPGKFPLNVPWFCAKFTLSIKCFLKTRINSFCLALAFPVPIFLSARPAAAFLQKSAP